MMTGLTNRVKLRWMARLGTSLQRSYVGWRVLARLSQKLSYVGWRVLARLSQNSTRMKYSFGSVVQNQFFFFISHSYLPKPHTLFLATFPNYSPAMVRQDTRHCRARNKSHRRFSKCHQHRKNIVVSRSSTVIHFEF